MIIAFIFFIHFLFALIIYTKKWQEEGVVAGLLNIGLILILFAVGWSISGMILKLFIDSEGFGLLLDRDTLSLILLTIAEIFFYNFYYREKPTEAGKEIQ